MKYWISVAVAFLGLIATRVPAVTYSELVQVVPGPGLPPQVKCMDSNNNLDLAWFDHRLFLGFRTAPNHFAGTKTRLYIVSSADQGRTWDYETEVFLGSDMREPRFLVLGDKLMFYFFEAGKNPFGFTPRHVWAMERIAKGEWSEKRAVYEPACVLWRAKVHNGKAYVSMYCGADKEYTGGNEGIGIHFLTTADGYNFEPVNPDRPVSSTGGSETAFEFAADDSLYLAIRNEGGDGVSWKSKVCTAEPADLSDWRCVESEYKFDSPIMFRQGDELYLIARRSLGGPYDKGQRWLPDPIETLYYLADYWWTPKRTALYRIDQQRLAAEPVLDFPSRGDTAFPGLVPLDADRWLMYNYSSDPEGKDRVWMSGQLHPTQIYSTIISF